MVPCATAPEPARPDDMGAVLAISRSLDCECPDSASPSQRALRRQVSEVGAVCSNSARTDLCGGHRATGVPTATEGTVSSQLYRHSNVITVGLQGISFLFIRSGGAEQV